jgi:arginase
MTVEPRFATSPLRPRDPGAPVALLGVPLDRNSSFLRGARFGPGALRAALASGSMNWSSEGGLDLESDSRWSDWGDVEQLDGDGALPLDDAMATIARAAGEVWSGGGRLLAIGGDHSISAPLLRAAARQLPPLTIVHFDAHPDLYPLFDDNPHSHASPFHRVMEEGLAARLVQVGIRAMNGVQRDAAARFGVEVVPAATAADWPGLAVDSPVYLSIDLDVLDPAFTPGVAHHEPGGLSVRELLTLISRVRGPVVAADLVELNPERDPTGRTAFVAAKLAKELLARLLAAL